MLLDAADSQLLVVDVQERLLPAVANPKDVVDGCAILMQAAARLELPTVISEQYPRGIGCTDHRLTALAPAGAVLEKISFSCAADEGLMARLEENARKQVVLCGIESHVCVLQTALELRQRDFEVFLVADAVSSRAPHNKDLAVARMREAGCHIISVEMAVFEWMRVAGTPLFKELSALIK